MDSIVTLYRPKTMRSDIPAGSPKNSIIRVDLSESVIVTNEFWNFTPHTPKKINDICIAAKDYSWKTTWELGKNDLTRYIYDSSGQHIGTIWQITSRIINTGSYYAYDDWYLQIWMTPSKTPTVLHMDLFEAAIAKKYLSFQEADIARWTIFRLMEILQNP